MTDQIPGPYAWPILGNMFDVRSDEGGSKALSNLADIYGPVYQVTLRGQKLIVISSAELLKQVTDEKYFVKLPPPALEQDRGAKGLFAARNEDPDWWQAHQILSPAFGVLPVQDMFEGMKDIASQLCLKWARMGPEHQILLTDDFTRLTLDTIALCAMDFRFNSFYSDGMHPFVNAMMGYLKFSGTRSNTPWIYSKIMGNADAAKNHENVRTMKSTAQEIINQRRTHPSKRRDLLNTMLYGKDSQSGEAMRDELIASNMMTFLIAGHETTSGLLSFAFMQLLKHPEAYLKAQHEVDTVIGSASIEPKHLTKLPYLNAVLRETLRLSPTAPGLTKTVHPDRRQDGLMFCGSRYRVEPDTPIRVLLGKAMSDISYFGDDAKMFVPERMLETNPHFDHFMEAWKPFGNGSRSCIGQNFAWQEALLVSAMVLQNFDMKFVDEKYQPRVVQSLTVKPKDLFVKVQLRKSSAVTTLPAQLYDGSHPMRNEQTSAARSPSPIQPNSNGKLTILFGSNAGTCQSLAQRLESVASSKYGLDVHTQTLDDSVKSLPSDHPVAIITASYEGQPPDNAARFVAWLRSVEGRDFNNVRYSVFGCGHKDWRQTLFAVPKFVDEALKSHGATRVYNAAFSDVSDGNVIDDFSVWQQGFLETVFGVQEKPQTIQPEQLAELTMNQRANRLSNGMTVARVTKARRLTAPNCPEKRDIEIELPLDTTYQCGDYIVVLPVNPDKLVRRVMAHWSIPWDATIVLKSKIYTPLPLNEALSVYELLRNEFELQQPAAKKDLETLKNCTTNAATIDEIAHILVDGSPEQRRLPVFEYLIKFPDIKLSFPEYLAKLLPLRVRQYSISSSPMAQPTTCTITYSVVRTIEDGNPVFEGVATSFLAALQPEDSIQISIRETATAHSKCPFRLPAQLRTPLLMFCAGTGLAPFRGFIQQRAFMLETNPGIQLSPALLFIGCRSASADRLYADELDKWAQAGAVDVRYAYSGEPEQSYGCRYIGDRMLRDQEDIVKLWRQDARVYICGSRRILDTVHRASEEILSAALEHESDSEGKRKRQLFYDSVADRVASDVFD